MWYDVGCMGVYVCGVQNQYFTFFTLMRKDSITLSHVRPRVKARIQCSGTCLFISHKDTALMCFEVIIAVIKH